MKISMVLPYWDRQEAADIALKKLAEHYHDLDMEIIVVDDGNKVPFVVPDVDLDIKTIFLPTKSAPKSPVTPWNEGVRAASGEVIVLSCVEILHTTAILPQMLGELKKMGRDGYVLAAAWCPEEDKWHCHSTVKLPRNPWGTGQSYCSMMHKELYERAGGFDEEYRDGAGYEDNDFINRLLAVGAVFNIRDDLVVTHPKSGAQIHWPAEAFERNKALFYSKWQDWKWPAARRPAINFVCVNWGNYCDRGAEYVNILYDSVRRNLPDDYPAKFICYTDDPTGLDEFIEPRALPETIRGWWSKLYLFKEGLFGAGERVIYFDLDTCIVGPLDNLLQYYGEFAVLRDFYHPSRVGPGVMLWRSGFGKDIWDSYEKAGFPTDMELGDLSWINHHFSEVEYKPDIIQSLFPGEVCSYKVHAASGIPCDAKVVCFHGYPRPHEAGGWVDEVWKIGGSTEFVGKNVSNTSYEIISSNIAHSSLLPLSWLKIEGAHDGIALIAGGGPSLAESIEEIRIRQQNGQKIFATNGTYGFLRQHGITPDFGVIIDARPENAAFLKDADDKTIFYLASQCAPETFSSAPQAVLMHMNYTEWHVESMIPPQDSKRDMTETAIIGGGSTVGLVSMSLAHTLGYRTIHLFGMDSSYRENNHHAYVQDLNKHDSVTEVEAAGKKFIASSWMIKQAAEFQQIASVMANQDCTVIVHGDGLLPHVARVMSDQQLENAA